MSSFILFHWFWLLYLGFKALTFLTTFHWVRQCDLHNKREFTKTFVVFILCKIYTACPVSSIDLYYAAYPDKIFKNAKHVEVPAPTLNVAWEKVTDLHGEPFWDSLLRKKNRNKRSPVSPSRVLKIQEQDDPPVCGIKWFTACWMTKRHSRFSGRIVCSRTFAQGA